MTRRKAKPITLTATGFFTEPVRAWAQMQFVSQIEIDPRTHRFVTDYARSQALRSGGGWNTRPVQLPGSLA